jgi:hypothetical protein
MDFRGIEGEDAMYALINGSGAGDGGAGARDGSHKYMH